MTNREYRLKYPIGTKIRYKPDRNRVSVTAYKDIGKQGTVVKHLECQVLIHLPASEKYSKTWRTIWENIEILSQKNQQLLFSFMD